MPATMKTIKSDRKLSLHRETLQHLTDEQMMGVQGGAQRAIPPELTMDKQEANCTFTR
jgi:hypothetical protein